MPVLFSAALTRKAIQYHCDAGACPPPSRWMSYKRTRDWLSSNKKKRGTRLNTSKTTETPQKRDDEKIVNVLGD